MRKRAENVAYPYDPARCPFTATWGVLAGKWKGVLWWRLSNGVGRFGDLQRAVPQATKKMLAQQLRELERDGIVRRTAHSGRTPRVEYALTEYGTTLAPVMEALVTWGEQHLRRRELAAPGLTRSAAPAPD